MVGTRFSVLLVDDDPDMHNLFQMIMDYHDHELAIVRDAESALNYLKAETPDVIVMDIFLPGIDGFQALHQIRKQALAPNCSVIATTAYHTSDTRDELLSRGFSGYLPKPLNTSTLVPYLTEMINRRSD
jgi:CheY-like chemotaxis protein